MSLSSSTLDSDDEGSTWLEWFLMEEENMCFCSVDLSYIRAWRLPPVRSPAAAELHFHAAPPVSRSRAPQEIHSTSLASAPR